MCVTIEVSRMFCYVSPRTKLPVNNHLIASRERLKLIPAVVFRVPSISISSSDEILSYRVGRGLCALKLANVRSARSQMTNVRGGLRYSC